MSYSLMLASLCLAVLASATAAQEAEAPASGSDPVEGVEATAFEERSKVGEVAATLALEALKPELDAAGQPVLGEDGQPVLSFQPVADGMALLPSDEFRYVVTVANAGSEVEAMELALDLPIEARLLPETVAASAEASFELGSNADPASRKPLFVEIDGLSVPNPAWVAAPEAFDQLLVTIERIASGETATVTYHLVVR